MSQETTDPERQAGIKAACAAMCFGLAGDNCDMCVDRVHCTKQPAWNADARLAVAAYLRATGRATEAEAIRHKKDKA
jgi:hypothetical protein